MYVEPEQTDNASSKEIFSDDGLGPCAKWEEEFYAQQNHSTASFKT